MTGRALTVSATRTWRRRSRQHWLCITGASPPRHLAAFRGSAGRSGAAWLSQNGSRRYAGAKNPAAFLAQRADEVEDEEERSRLRRIAEKFRAGDYAGSPVGGLTGAAIRAGLGLKGLQWGGPKTVGPGGRGVAAVIAP